jgi:hypothetical protein
MENMVIPSYSYSFPCYRFSLFPRAAGGAVVAVTQLLIHPFYPTCLIIQCLQLNIKEEDK